MVGRAWDRCQIVDQLDDVVGKAIRAEVAGPSQGPGRGRVRPGGATQAEVDPPRVQGFQSPELLCDDKRRLTTGWAA